MNRPRVVQGVIELPSDAPEFTPAGILVELEDVSRADAPSPVVQRVQIPPRALSGGAVVPFVLEVPAERVSERNSYSIRVHVDLSGTGEIQPGDYISMQSFPVLTQGHGDRVCVSVRRV